MNARIQNSFYFIMLKCKQSVTQNTMKLKKVRPRERDKNVWVCVYNVYLVNKENENRNKKRVIKATASPLTIYYDCDCDLCAKVH